MWETKRNQEGAPASLPSRDNGIQALGDFSPKSFPRPRSRVGLMSERTPHSDNAHTAPHLGVPSKSGTARQLSAPLGGRVNSGVDGKSDTIGPAPSPPATHAAQGGPGPLRGAGSSQAAAVSPARARPHASHACGRAARGPGAGTFQQLGGRAAAGPPPRAAAAAPRSWMTES